MVKKFVLWIIGILLLGVFCYVLIMLNSSKDKTQRSIDSYVPQTSDLVLRENDKSFEKYENILAINGSTHKGRNMRSVLIDSLCKHGIIEIKCADRIALKQSGTSYNYLSIYSTLPGDSYADLKRIYTKVAGVGVEERNIAGSVVLSGADSLLVVSKQDNCILISNSFSFIEESIRGGKSPDSLKVSFSDKYLSTESQCNIILKGNAIGKACDWAAFDADLEKNQFIAQGFMGIASSGWYEALTEQKAKRSSFDDVFTDAIVGITWLNLSDVSNFMLRVSDYSSVESKASDFTRILESCDTILDGNVVCANTIKGNLFFVGVSEGWFALNVLERELDGNISFTKNDCQCWDLQRQVSVISCFGPIFSGININCVSIIGNCLVFGDSRDVIQSYIDDFEGGRLLKSTLWYKSYIELCPSTFSFRILYKMDCISEVKLRTSGSVLNSVLSDLSNKNPFFATCGVQGEYNSDNIYLSVICGGEKSPKANVENVVSIVADTVIKQLNKGENNSEKLNNSDVNQQTKPKSTELKNSDNTNGKSSDKLEAKWTKLISGKVIMQPVSVINHNTKAKEWLVQDSKNILYLFTSNYKLLWKAQLSGRINSDIVQVDCYKNGKLQYLFSTEKNLFLVDRNGNSVKGFPIKFPASCIQGISVYDYDFNKNYRIFVPCNNNCIYLYDALGHIVDGWKVPKFTNEIVSKATHIRTGGKDYIVIADKKTLHILDRKGAVRVPCTKAFTLNSGTKISLGTIKGVNAIVVTTDKGKKIYIDFNGNEIY